MEEFDTRTKTLEKIYNKLHRYRKKLILEGIEEIKDKGLRLKIRKDRGLKVINRSPTIYIGEKETDIGDLIDLSKKRVPSLYRRYHQDLEKMGKILDYEKL